MPKLSRLENPQFVEFARSMAHHYQLKGAQERLYSWATTDVEFTEAELQIMIGGMIQGPLANARWLSQKYRTTAAIAELSQQMVKSAESFVALLESARRAT